MGSTSKQIAAARKNKRVVLSEQQKKGRVIALISHWAPRPLHHQHGPGGRCPSLGRLGLLRLRLAPRHLLRTAVIDETLPQKLISLPITTLLSFSTPSTSMRRACMKHDVTAMCKKNRTSRMTRAETATSKDIPDTLVVVS